MIRTGRTYQVDYPETIQRITNCEACGERFCYRLTVIGTGRGYSLLWLRNAGAIKEAHEEARRDLANQKVQDVGFVPCPVCGWYQETMVKKHRHERLNLWVAPATIYCFLIGSFLLLLLDHWGFIEVRASINDPPSQKYASIAKLAILPVTTFIVGWCWVRLRHLNYGHPGTGKIHAERAAASKAVRIPAVTEDGTRQ